MRKNGFTLIELLAVIVILAIIALIATPIILGIINDAREESNERSVQMYASALKNAVAKYQLNGNGSVTGTLTTTDGRTFNETDMKVEYDGKDVVCSTIELYQDGNVYLDKCTVNGGEQKYNYGTKEESVFSDICTPVTEATKTSGNVPKGNFEIGDEYICEVKNGTSYTFFILSKNGNNVNLILDSNIAANGIPESLNGRADGVEWISDEDYGCGENGSWCALKDKGPITAINFLNSATSTWTNIPPLNEIYDDEYETYFDFKLTGIARMPSLSELTSINCSFYEINSCPLWAINYLNYMDEYESAISSSSAGYWTLTAMSGSQGSGGAYSVTYGYLYDPSTTYYEEGNGVRPVITLKIK